MIYFDFLKKCIHAEGSFINYIEHQQKTPTDQNNKEDLSDSQGRALWALAEVMNNDRFSPLVRDEAKNIFISTISAHKTSIHLRAQALMIKACELALHVLPHHKKELINCIEMNADSLVASLQQATDGSWIWFENLLSYNNGLLPESLLIAGRATKNKLYYEKGLETLSFLIKKTFLPSYYMPIGNAHWHAKNHVKSLHDQQPEDPCSMILALEGAYRMTNDPQYVILIKKCFSWYLGNNTSGAALYNAESGGCFDGLRPDKINTNQGAESLVSYLMSWSVMDSFV
jgi:hypothetical protein